MKNWCEVHPDGEKTPDRHTENDWRFGGFGVFSVNVFHPECPNNVIYNPTPGVWLIHQFCIIR
jgi:hypothetical protein